MFLLSFGYNEDMALVEINFSLPTDYSEEELWKKIAKKLGYKDFTYYIDLKSLDSRDKRNIHWRVRVIASRGRIDEGRRTWGERRGTWDVGRGVKDVGRGTGDEGRGTNSGKLVIPYKKRNKSVVVVGSGPAGFFAALVLQKAGFDVTILERGLDVDSRTQAIEQFEAGGAFSSVGNYAFGEGGAGTFSDGKLTSRTKHISLEKSFVIDNYIGAGAPAEIAYMAHPHVGSDNLRAMMKRLRQQFEALGGVVTFETQLLGIKVVDRKATDISTTSEVLNPDIVIVASGNSAYDTYRTLIKSGVGFRNKNFAIGCRVEHPQALINMAQWGVESLPGVLAAEYRLTYSQDGGLPVYTFCMCPGGKVVPAMAYEGQSAVNGMSLFNRDGQFANAACVAGVGIADLSGQDCTPLEALDWLERMEQRFYEYAGGYQSATCRISDFLEGKLMSETSLSSYPLGLKQAALWEFFPSKVSEALRLGLQDFSRKLRGFETGTMIGFESKTSSPIQAIREDSGCCSGLDNLFMVGEGSGYSGGIISSAVDGIRCAVGIAER